MTFLLSRGINKADSGRRLLKVSSLRKCLLYRQHFAGMAELADALDSGSSEGFLMQVQVLFPAYARKALKTKGTEKSSLIESGDFSVNKHSSQHAEE